MSDEKPAPSATIALTSVRLCWLSSLFLTLMSLALWAVGVQQLATWQAAIPAAALITGLYAIIASLRWRKTEPAIQNAHIWLTSFPGVLWSIAIAIGI